jgi:hypothetical protein
VRRRRTVRDARILDFMDERVADRSWCAVDTSACDRVPFELAELSDAQCTQHFRFDRAELETMMAPDHGLLLPTTFQTDNRSTFSGAEGWLALLYRFKYPGRLVDMQALFRVEYSQLSRLISTVLHWFHATHGHLLTDVSIWVPHMQV